VATDVEWRQGAQHVRRQAAACAEMGSPLYAGLLTRVADDLLASGPAADVLAGHERDDGPSALALRLMGGVHRLVLERAAPELATFYPSVGGTADPERAWPAFRNVLSSHRDQLAAGLGQPPQTNEVGRAAALLGGLLHVVAGRPPPIRLYEMGASAGLNLRPDHLRVTFPAGSVGPPDAPVVLADGWSGAIPPSAGALQIVDRAGCDVWPVDPTTTDGRLLLTSYVWADQLPRLERLRGALELAARVPAAVHKQTAADFLRELRLAPGTTTVLWHSVMWQYLPDEEKRAVRARLEELGREATAEAGFAHLRMEPETRADLDGHAFYVVLRSWPGGEERVLGTAAPHGLPTHWR
jgi:hypothetical protein